MEKRFELNQDLVRHQCETWHEGAWIYFSCATCGFLRKLNYETGKLETVQQGDQNVLHAGSHAPLAVGEKQGISSN